MCSKGSSQKCSLVMIAEGFAETEAIGMLCALRKAGLCTKYVGLTNGLINGAHGISIMPDFTLADLERALDIKSLNLIILPGGERHLASLEADPRVHRLLRQVVVQQGIIVADVSGVQWVTQTIRQDHGTLNRGVNVPLIVHHPFEQPIEIFAQDVIRHLERKFPA